MIMMIIIMMIMIVINCYIFPFVTFRAGPSTRHSELATYTVFYEVFGSAAEIAKSSIRTETIGKTETT